MPGQPSGLKPACFWLRTILFGQVCTCKCQKKGAKDILSACVGASCTHMYMHRYRRLNRVTISYTGIHVHAKMIYNIYCKYENLQEINASLCTVHSTLETNNQHPAQHSQYQAHFVCQIHFLSLRVKIQTNNVVHEHCTVCHYSHM